MGYKYRYKYPFEDGNYAIVEINYIGNEINQILIFTKVD